MLLVSRAGLVETVLPSSLFLTFSANCALMTRSLSITWKDITFINVMFPIFVTQKYVFSLPV
jgi:hypothetical protein